MTTEATSFESNSTDGPNITGTARLPTAIAKTMPEEINSTDITTTDEFNITSTFTINDEEITTLSDETKSEATSGSQNSTAIEQLDQSSGPLLYGITFTGVIVASSLGGLTCLVVCVIASVMITVKIYRRKIHRRQRIRREEISATNFLAVYVPWPEVDMTRNAAYHSGQQVRADLNVYSSRPSNGAVLSRNGRPKPMLPPRRYAQLNDRQMNVSVDSQG